MRELERPPHSSPALFSSLAVVGRGRLGPVLAAALSASGLRVSAPLGRGADLDGYDVILLCVPDGQIAGAAKDLPPGRIVGHCSGATGLEVLSPHEAFSLHPLMTVTGQDSPERLKGAGAAIAGSTSRARAIARELALAAGLDPFELDESDRAAYHAAASVASNFLVTLQAAAERIADGTGAERERFAPLVRATVENWARLGPEAALTGPVARGDRGTVERQRAAVAERAPELLAVFDALVEATETLAARSVLVGTA